MSRLVPQRRIRSAIGTTRSIQMFDGVSVEEGGWNYSRRWMTAEDRDAALSRWAMKAYEGRASDEHQCGGCQWFAAFDSDYGLCWNGRSARDGHVMFEHGGCDQHSDIVRPER